MYVTRDGDFLKTDLLFEKIFISHEIYGSLIKW